MIAVILAAGSSYRMRPLTDHMPKGLLPVAGRPILAQILNNLRACGLQDALFVTGYKEEMIKDFVRAHSPDLHVRYVTNEIYASCSDSVSVFKSLQHIGNENILLIDSDQWFYPQVIESLLQASEPDVIAFNRKDLIDEEAVKVVIDSNNRVLELGKPVNPAKAVGEAVGVRKFSSNFLRQMYAVLERRIMREGLLDQVFECSVQEMLEHGVPLFAVDTSTWPSIEMDTPEDYQRAQQLITDYETSLGAKS